VSEHLLCCIDRVEPRGDGSVGVVVDGWCLASLPVESLWIATPDRARHPVSQGRPRADVGDAYPGYPDAADAGIAFQLPVAADEVTFGVTVKSPFGRTRTAETTLFLEPGRVQRLDILPARPPPSDIEGELVRCLDRGRGLMLRLDLVNRCNLRCVMCHHSDPAVRARPRGEIGLAGFQEIFASVAPWIREVMLSCADEPLVAREFAEGVAYLSGFPAVAVSFCTNGMLLD